MADQRVFFVSSNGSRRKDIFGEEENTKISGKTRKYFDDDGKKPVLIKKPSVVTSRASACALAN